MSIIFAELLIIAFCISAGEDDAIHAGMQFVAFVSFLCFAVATFIGMKQDKQASLSVRQL